jgi:hypothetical protein
MGEDGEALVLENNNTFKKNINSAQLKIIIIIIIKIKLA